MKASELILQDRFVSSFPADPEKNNFRRQVTGAAYSEVMPQPCSAPRIIALSNDLAAQLGINPDADDMEAWADLLSGNHINPGFKPYASCYGGHQFGHWAGQLGDGRVINLGEIPTPHGLQTLQLKGAGPTPYSRNADGLAVLRSSVREFLCSEAMHYLGVPTTRALSLVLTGDQVMRDLLYDGNPAYEPGAVVCRVAPDFIRFGHFEIFAARQDHELLRRMADYTLLQHYPHLGPPSQAAYLAMFEEIAHRTLDMIIHWLRVGFVHGVMNTDNMSALGLTIDYGPYGWLEAYQENFTPNTTDRDGRRYAFGQQANISLWNLWKLGNALYPIIGEVQGLQAVLEAYPQRYQQQYLAMMISKLGLVSSQPGDGLQMKTLLEHMERDAVDYQLFFRGLSDWDVFRPTSSFWKSLMIKSSYLDASVVDERLPDWQPWIEWYAARLQAENLDFETRQKQMNQVNPAFILRNYMVYDAIEMAQKEDYSAIHSLLEMSKDPYTLTPANARWLVKSPEWAFEKPGCSMLSCSS